MGNTTSDDGKLPNIYGDTYYEPCQRYYGQEPKDHDGYGDPTYERQKPNHWGEMPLLRDCYGNPDYGNGGSVCGGGYSFGGGQSYGGVLPKISSRVTERTQQRIQEESHVSKKKNSNKKETKPKTSKEQEQPKKENDKVRDSDKDIILPKFKENKDVGIKVISDNNTNNCINSNRKKIFLKTNNNQEQPKKENVEIKNNLPNNTEQTKLIQNKGDKIKVNYKNTINNFAGFNKKEIKATTSMSKQPKIVVVRNKGNLPNNTNNCVSSNKNKTNSSYMNQKNKKTNPKPLKSGHNKATNNIIKYKANNKSKSPTRPNFRCPNIIKNTTNMNRKRIPINHLYKLSCRPR